MAYRENSELVIKNISFNIKPGEKVGVVGRTVQKYILLN